MTDHHDPRYQHPPRGESESREEYQTRAMQWLLEVTSRLILPAIERIEKRQETLMATMAELQAAVAAEDTVIDSVLVLIQGMADQIAALKPNQAAIDALAADVKAKSDALSAAVTANTPASP